MRYRARIDENQPEIVAQLKECGVSVQALSAVGNGVTDLLCGFRGLNILLEVKDPTKPKADRQLTKSQVKWHGAWRGQKSVVHDFSEAMNAINTHWDECRGNVSRRCSITNSTLGQLKRDIPVEK